MFDLAKALVRVLLSFGIDPRRTLRAFFSWPVFIRDAHLYRKKHLSVGNSIFPLRLRNLYPIVHERTDEAGAMGVYFYQDMLVAQRVFDRKPSRHLDIGSRVDGFVSHLLIFMDVQIVDVRPLNGIEGLSCIQADACNLNDYIPDDSIESLSCLHALEHFGLGRYGDEIDPVAWQSGLCEMYRILKPSGIFYLSVPVGDERLNFNAHRVFSPLTIFDYACQIGFSLRSATHVDDNGIVKDGVSESMLRGREYVITEDSVMIYELIK